MIGDKRLRLYREALSTPWVFAALERAAIRLGHGELFRGQRGAVDDDHVPFLKIGVPAANLIDLSFGPGWNSNSYWHTAKDTVDKISPDSMAAVGAIVVEALPDLCAGKPSTD
jgi:Zn-dependent M28 family amino/carboxypeptidase